MHAVIKLRVSIIIPINLARPWLGACTVPFVAVTMVVHNYPSLVSLRVNTILLDVYILHQTYKVSRYIWYVSYLCQHKRRISVMDKKARVLSQ